MEKVTNGSNVVRNIVYVIATIIFVAAVGYYGYQYFFTANEVVSNNKLFTIDAPGRYDFIQNNNATDEKFEMAVYDKKSGVHIFGYAFQKQAGLKEYVKTEREEVAKDENYNKVTKVQEFKIGKENAYSYTYQYVDNNSKEYYAKIVYIESKQNDYLLVLESPTSSLKSHQKQLDNMMNSFKENKN